MTATQTAPFSLPPTFVAMLRRVGLIVFNAALALVIIFAAGVIAVSTAAAGLAFAGVVLMFRMVSGGRASQATPRRSGDAGLTLEARKTSHGWTVE